jgi:type IV secretion system protein VirB5
MAFKKTTSTFPPKSRGRGNHSGGVTPYSQAASEWDNRIGSARVQARNWRIMAFAAMGGMLLLGIGLITLSRQKQVETFLVEVDPAGMPGRVTLAGQRYDPDDATVGYFVGELVKLVRQRPVDPVVMRQNWAKAYQFLAGGAVASMNRYAATDPGIPGSFDRSAGQSSTLPGARIVEIGSVVQQSERTWQVRWIEMTYANGVERRREQYTGLFHVAIRPPKTEAETFRNPLGLYVTDFNWSREYTAPVVPDQDTP